MCPPVPAQQLTDVAQSLFHEVSVQGLIPANPPHHGSGDFPSGIRTPVEWPVFPLFNLLAFRLPLCSPNSNQSPAGKKEWKVLEPGFFLWI